MINRRKRIVELTNDLKALNYDLTYEEYCEKVKIAYEKRKRHEKIGYDEFVMMLLTNDELSFEYNEKVYEIVHEEVNITSLYCVSYSSEKLVSNNIEKYSSVVELLSIARIESKTIRDIWNLVIFK